MTRSTSITFLAGAAVVLLSAAALAGCGSGGGARECAGGAPEDHERTAGHARRCQ